jgi:hypothetical protein
MQSPRQSASLRDCAFYPMRWRDCFASRRVATALCRERAQHATLPRHNSAAMLLPPVMPLRRIIHAETLVATGRSSLAAG